MYYTIVVENDQRSAYKALRKERAIKILSLFAGMRNASPEPILARFARELTNLAMVME